MMIVSISIIGVFVLIIMFMRNDHKKKISSIFLHSYTPTQMQKLNTMVGHKGGKHNVHSSR